MLDVRELDRYEDKEKKSEEKSQEFLRIARKAKTSTVLNLIVTFILFSYCTLLEFSLFWSVETISLLHHIAFCYCQHTF